MSWDIYGERLERGHCEVHPWIAMEYPCPLCQQEQSANEARRWQEEEQNEMLKREEDIYWITGSFGEGI